MGFGRGTESPSAWVPSQVLSGLQGLGRGHREGGEWPLELLARAQEPLSGRSGPREAMAWMGGTLALGLRKGCWAGEMPGEQPHPLHPPLCPAIWSLGTTHVTHLGSLPRGHTSLFHLC